MDEIREMKINVAEWLRYVRLKKNMNQTQVGDLVGLHQSSVARIEMGSQSLSAEEYLVLKKLMEQS